jgi:hypothetical protein
MKKIKFILVGCLLACASGMLAQGLEGIVVEKYYQTNAADAAEATANGAVAPLTVGSTVYRIYVDMAAGYKFSQIYGSPSHNLTVNSTANFYNDPSYGVSLNAGTISAINIVKETAMIDSWFTTGFASNGKVGVLKTEDSNGTVGNTSGVLINNPGDCYGLPIVGAGAQDGMIISAAANAITPNPLGLGSSLNAINQTAGNSITIANGGIAALGGIVGATASNMVLIGQFTTSGQLSFSLNVQLVNISTGLAENYVASAPVAGELTHPSLTYVPNTPPVVSISAPANAATLSQGITTITANASDIGGSVSSVEFFVDGVSIGVDNAGPAFSMSYTATLGAHTIYAIAKDNDCATTTSTTININVTAVVSGSNDSFASAQQASLAGAAYPFGACFNGTLVGSTVSSEGTAANVLPVGGQDKWYKIVATSSAIRVTSTTSSMNVVLELHNAAGAQIDVENDVAGIGGENMTTTGLTPGATYYIAIRSFDGAVGTFSVCIQTLTESFCSDGSGIYNLCSSFKPKWVGANSYVFNFTPVMGTPGSPTSASSTGQIPLSAPALNLRYGGVYEVTVDVVFNLPEGEVVTLLGTSVCTVTIASHAGVEVKSSQRCPATLLKGSIMQGKPFVCGALNFTVEFIELTSCTGTQLGLPITATTTGSSSSINLSLVSGVLGGGRWYQVSWRPNFSYGPGTYGTPQNIFVGGSSMDTGNVEANLFNDKVVDADSFDANLYPNPNNGTLVNLSINSEDANEVFIRIMDYTGKVIYNNKYMVDSILNTQLQFEQSLASGIYLVEFVAGDKVVSSKLMVEK